MDVEPIGQGQHQGLMVEDLVIRRPREEPLTLLDPTPRRRGHPGRVHEVLLPGFTTPPISSNDPNGPEHRHIVNGKRRDLQRKMFHAIRAAGWPKFHGVISCGLVYYLRNNGHADAENIAPSLKPCIDVLKPLPPEGTATRKRHREHHFLGLIPEDHSEFVRYTWQQVVQRGEDPHPEWGPRLWFVVVELE